MKWVGETGKLDCPGCHAKIPGKDLEAIFVEDFFDMTAGHPNLAPAMSASSAHRDFQAELAAIQGDLQDAQSRREGVEKMLTSGSINQKRFEELHPPLEREVRHLEAKVHHLQKKGSRNTLVRLTLAEWKKQWES